jgi:hypothetical protein
MSIIDRKERENEKKRTSSHLADNGEQSRVHLLLHVLLLLRELGLLRKGTGPGKSQVRGGGRGEEGRTRANK